MYIALDLPSKPAVYHAITANKRHSGVQKTQNHFVFALLHYYTVYLIATNSLLQCPGALYGWQRENLGIGECLTRVPP